MKRKEKNSWDNLWFREEQKSLTDTTNFWRHYAYDSGLREEKMGSPFYQCMWVIRYLWPDKFIFQKKNLNFRLFCMLPKIHPKVKKMNLSSFYVVWRNISKIIWALSRLLMKMRRMTIKQFPFFSHSNKMSHEIFQKSIN